MSEDTPLVKIKGVGSSLWVMVPPDAPLEAVKSELARQLEPLNLTPASRVILDTGPGADPDGRRGQISAYLKETFALSDIAAPQDKETESEKRFPLRTQRNVISQNRGDSLVLAGRVRSGQAVHAKKHLVVYGDVNPGCELIAGGDIIILGCLSGTAAAGQPDNRDAIILAFDFRPIQIKIGDLVAAGLPPTEKGAVEYAHVEDGGIIVEDYFAANPFKRLPFPVVR
jgi:septum site-determining protein MinC